MAKDAPPLFDLPHKSGIEIARAMRRCGSTTPVLFLTALGAEALEKAHHVFASMWEGLDPSQLRTRK